MEPVPAAVTACMHLGIARPCRDITSRTHARTCAGLDPSYRNLVFRQLRMCKRAVRCLAAAGTGCPSLGTTEAP